MRDLTRVVDNEIYLEYATNESWERKRGWVPLITLIPTPPQKATKGKQGQIVAFAGPHVGSILNVKGLVRFGGKGSKIKSATAWRTGSPKDFVTVSAFDCTRVEGYDVDA